MSNALSTHSILMYVTAVAALVLLAPYAGCHIFTTPPEIYEGTSVQPAARGREKKTTERPSSSKKNDAFSDLDELLK